MNIYQISGRSDCGSYFEPYLQSVTVIANDEEHAFKIVNESLYKNQFVTKDLHCLLLASDIKLGDIVDYHEAADY